MPLIEVIAQHAIEVHGSKIVRVSQPYHEQQLHKLVKETPIDYVIIISLLLIEERVRNVEEETLSFPEERVYDPIGEPLNQGLLILLDLKEAETLPHGIS